MFLKALEAKDYLITDQAAEIRKLKEMEQVKEKRSLKISVL